MAVYVDLIRYRELFANLFRRDFQAKYRGSVLGLVWSLVNPIALMAVYLVVFGLLWPGSDIPYYPLYLLAGLACWIFFATSLQAGARSLVESAELVKKVRFPRQLVPFSVVATQLVTFAAMLGILICCRSRSCRGRGRTSFCRSRSPCFSSASSPASP